MAISSTECSTWLTVYLTITVAIVAVNLLSIILFVKNSNLRTRTMYLVINLTVVDMFVGGSATILSIEATFVNITFQSSKQEDLNDTLSVRLSHTRENRSNSRYIFEKVRRS